MKSRASTLCSKVNYWKNLAFILIFSLFLSNSSYAISSNKKTDSLNLSFNLVNKTLGQVIEEVQAKSECVFFIYDNNLDANRKVSLKTTDLTLSETLDELFKGTNNTYVIDGKQIYVNKKVAESKTIAPQQDSKKVTITGNVVDEFDDPIPGAAVRSQGTTIGVLTDQDGNFKLGGVEKGATITISFLGLVTHTIIAEDGKSYNVKMKEDVALLGEVVVVGYGSQKKVNLTGSVSVVTPDDIADRPVANVSQALQGVVPGLNFSVGSGGGALNSKMGVSIRGTGTIGDGSNGEPLVLIDGIEGDLNSIAPQDIGSISVLKDASSAAIYGARGAFGVILITTKSGKSGKTRISYSNSFRFSNPISTPETMDGRMFANYWNRAAENSGQSHPYDKETMALIEKTMTNNWTAAELAAGLQNGARPNPTGNSWYSYDKGHANTDWFAEHYKKNAFSQEHNVNLSGGTDASTYMISGSFLNQDGMSRHGDDSFSRYNLSAKMDFKVFSNLKLDFATKWIREDYDRASYMTGLFYHNIARRWPTGAIVDGFGNYTSNSEIIQLQDGGRDRDQKDRLVNQLALTYEPIKDWNIYANGSLQTTFRNNHWDILPVYEHNVENKEVPFSPMSGYIAGASRVSESTWKDNYYTMNFYTDYFRQMGDHYLKGMIGFNAELTKSRMTSSQGDGLISKDIPTVSTATEKFTANGTYDHHSLAGFFGRFNYNYKERYLLEVNGRYDGVSRFIGNKTWGFFPSVSAGWNISNEDFYRDHFGAFAKAVQTLKFRGSWGDLGNMNTKALYPFYRTMPFTAQGTNWLLNKEKPNIASAPAIVTDLLTWERVRTWDIGFDFGAFNNRLTGTFDYFSRTTLDMMGPAPELPAILGVNPPKINNTDMRTTGWEFQIGWRDRIGEVEYGIKFNLSDLQNKILKYPNLSNDLAQRYSGQMDGEIWGLASAGIAQSQEQIDAHIAKNKPSWGSNWQAGDIMYQDLNGDGVVNNGDWTLENPGDYKVIGNSTPRYTYGINANIAWKGIDVSVFFQGVGKRDWMSGTGDVYFWGANGQGMWQAAGFKEHWDFWRPEGDPLGANTGAYYPRVTFDDNKNIYAQDRYIQDASYIRLKNFQVGYTLPQSIVTKLRATNIRIYVSGDNMWTSSSLKAMFDPETLGGDYGAGKTYPLQKVMSFGLNVNF